MADPTGPAWAVVSQTETTDLGDDGTYVPGVKVVFRTAKGVTGSVFVRGADYTPDRVRQLVAARAVVADEIAGMAG